MQGMIPVATNLKTKELISFDFTRSRALFACGKRGSGKSYSLGKIIEGIHREGQHLMVVIDPLSVFWPTCIPVEGAPKIPVNLLVPGDLKASFGVLAERMPKYGVKITRLRLNPADLSLDAWLKLLGLKLGDVQGIALSRAHRGLQGAWGLPDFIEAVGQDDKSNKRTIEACVNRLDGLEHLGIFGQGKQSITDLLDEDAVNVIDISGLDAGADSLRNLVVELVVNDLFNLGLESKKLEQVGLPRKCKSIFLGVDEAHNFAPKVGDALGKKPLVRWIKEGRSADLSIAMATQEPNAIDYSFASQCDIRMIHLLTAADDIKVASKLAGSKWGPSIAPLMKAIEGAGRCIIVDDAAKRAVIGEVLARDSVHGGGKLPPLPEIQPPTRRRDRAAWQAVQDMLASYA